MRPTLPAACSVLAAFLCGCAAAPPESAPVVRTRTYEMGPMRIDRIYHSMDGPHERLTIDPTDLAWITGYSTHVIDADTGERLGDEFFCHSQIQMVNETRLLVTATGIADVRFPEGFGLPLHRVLRGMPPPYRGVTVLGMVLNNFDATMNRLTKVRGTIEYMTDEAARARRLRKLFKVELPMTVVPKSDETPEDAQGEHCVVVGGLKSHWLVPPGTQTTKRRFTGLFPVDARVHFAAVHLHNYGRFMILRDASSGQELWRTDVAYEPSRIQIAKIPYYSSVEGFPVFKDREYEIEAFYDNTGEAPTDAMAVMYLYYNPNVDVDITYPVPPSPATGV